MPRKPVIMLTGPEGSGKSTLANLVKKYFETRKEKAKIVRLRGTHTISYLLMIFLRDFVKLHGKSLHYYRVALPRRMVKLWLLIEFISVIPLVILYYYIMRIKYIIISERSIIDVVIWWLTGVNANIRTLLSFFPVKIMLLLSVSFRNRTFFVTADLPILLSRKLEEKDLIVRMLPFYRALARYLNLKTIDTGTSHPNKCALKILREVTA